MKHPVPADHPAPALLRTERLVLRRWQPADREPFAAMNADRRVMEHFPHQLSRTESDALVDRIEQSFADTQIGLWVVECGGAFLGFTGLVWQLPPLPFAPAIEVGWRLTTSAWGNGYATEAARAAINDGFTRVPVNAIVSMTAATNTRSLAVMRRLGMHAADTDRFNHPKVTPGDRLAPHILARLTRRDWDEQSTAGTNSGAAGAGSVPRAT
jgi:RimJ/RimL family protein N-acetyltransferase